MFYRQPAGQGQHREAQRELASLLGVKRSLKGKLNGYEECPYYQSDKVLRWKNNDAEVQKEAYTGASEFDKVGSICQNIS